jgi:hypothetical protein
MSEDGIQNDQNMTCGTRTAQKTVLFVSATIWAAFGGFVHFGAESHHTTAAFW